MKHQVKVEPQCLIDVDGVAACRRKQTQAAYSTFYTLLQKLDSYQ